MGMCPKHPDGKKRGKHIWLTKEINENGMTRYRYCVNCGINTKWNEEALAKRLQNRLKISQERFAKANKKLTNAAATGYRQCVKGYGNSSSGLSNLSNRVPGSAYGNFK